MGSHPLSPGRFLMKDCAKRAWESWCFNSKPPQKSNNTPSPQIRACRILLCLVFSKLSLSSLPPSPRVCFEEIRFPFHRISESSHHHYFWNWFPIGQLDNFNSLKFCQQLRAPALDWHRKSYLNFTKQNTITGDLVGNRNTDAYKINKILMTSAYPTGTIQHCLPTLFSNTVWVYFTFFPLFLWLCYVFMLCWSTPYLSTPRWENVEFWNLIEREIVCFGRYRW